MVKKARRDTPKPGWRHTHETSHVPSNDTASGLRGFNGGRGHHLTTGEFVTGDVWHGTLTSCHQGLSHMRRHYRYFPIELSIDKVDRKTGEITATFVTHLDRSFYELKGMYDPGLRRLFLTPTRGKVGQRWEPCDAEAFMSPDFSTLSGVSRCEAHGECDAGGGEFLLRHDRTQFAVEGAGDIRVNGIYYAQPRLPPAAAPGATAKPPKYSSSNLYDGAPVYLQACGDTDRCEPFAIVHEVIGQYGFWRILPSSSLTANLDPNAPELDHAVYSVCSEDVYPPEGGWRPLGGGGVGSAPAPAVRAMVRSMYANLETHASPVNSADTDTGFYSAVALVMLGGILWLLVWLGLKSGVRMKKKGGPRGRGGSQDYA